MCGKLMIVGGRRGAIKFTHNALCYTLLVVSVDGGGYTFTEESESDESPQSFLRCMGVVWRTLCQLSSAFIACRGLVGGRMVAVCCWHSL